MEYGALTLEPTLIAGGRNHLGQFTHRYESEYKGKTWDERHYTPEAKAKMLAGLRKAQETARLAKIGKPNCRRKKVVAILDDGRWKVFSHAGAIAQLIPGMRKNNITQTCRLNANPPRNAKTGELNTDHKHQGVRFYFEDDPQWMEKIGVAIATA